MLVFYGSGLYEDPELGWGGLATEGIRAFGIPGEHDNNRQAMSEPGVGFVTAQLKTYLAEVDGDHGSEPVAAASVAG
jgi:hypothetical protein